MSMAYTIKRYIGFVSLVFVFLLILSTEARADLYGFECITNNVPGDVAIGEAQLFVDVADPGTNSPEGNNQVLFTFSNVGPLASSITDVYFEDGTLLGIASIDNSDPGVSFSQNASPPDLPGGNAMQPPFNVTASFLADSDPPPMANGVNPGESLGILFDLKVGKTFTDVIAAINQGFTGPIFADQSLRIAIHVQGFDGGGSESLVMTPTPGSLLLGSIGIGMVIARCRRKRKTLIES